MPNPESWFIGKAASDIPEDLMEAAKHPKHEGSDQSINCEFFTPIKLIFPTIDTASIQKDLLIPYGKYYRKLNPHLEVEKSFKFSLSIKIK